MNGVLAEGQLVLLAAAAFFVLASLIATPLAHVIERATRSWVPALRHRALLTTATMPLVLGIAALLATLSPSVIALVLTGTDHCATHDDGHAHLCFVHLPKHGPGGVAWLVLGAACAWLAAHLVEGIADLVRAHRIVRPLLAAATPDRRGCLVVPSERAFCVSIGLFRARVLVSDAFLERTSETQARAALLHEGAHVRRRDALARIVARGASLLYPAPTRRLLLAELDVAAERACDESAAGAIGDRLAIAEAILAVERLLQDDGLHALSVVRAMTSLAVSRRVEALVEPATTQGTASAIPLMVLAFLLALFSVSPPLHHAAESLLASVLHASR